MNQPRIGWRLIGFGGIAEAVNQPRIGWRLIGFGGIAEAVNQPLIGSRPSMPPAAPRASTNSG
ncbi:hypothetical protein [Roseococcus thiosulfatophilus]|uniref:hypothetical protein n=1 Tax=Roseococcus thiosulfatophilus TaxID=35813 RepID=UPI001A9032FD|nr:hypothetical protein [Roseococcus thiosulfatophilus]